MLFVWTYLESQYSNLNHIIIYNHFENILELEFRHLVSESQFKSKQVIVGLQIV